MAVKPVSAADPHQDQALEKQILAALQADPGLYWRVADRLAPEDFVFHRQEYRDFLAGLDRTAARTASQADAADLVDQARRLGGLHQKRELAQILQRSFQDLAEPGNQAPDLLAGLEGELTRLQNLAREQRAGQLVTLAGVFPDLLADVEKRRAAVRAGAGSVGVPTGFPKLDRLLGGLQTGLHLLAAEPGAGKTTLALNLAAHAAGQGVPVLFVSFEETLQRLALKTVCLKAGLVAKDFADGYAEPARLAQAVAEHRESLAGFHLLEGTSHLTAADLKARALQVLGSWGADRGLVVLDYLQRWASTRKESPEFRLRVNLVVSELRELALRLDSPVLAISSQNRAGQGTAAMTSLKESAELEYSADSLLFLTESKDAIGGTVRGMELTLQKNRFGEKGKVNLVFNPAQGRFAEEAFGR